MKKKFLSVFLVALICIPLVGCNNPSKGNSDKDNTKITQSSSVNEKDANYEKHEALGVEFNLPSKWKEKSDNLSPLGLDGSENIVGQLKYDFCSSETLEKMKKLNEDSKKIPENDKEKMEKFQEEYSNLFTEFKELCTITTIDKSKPEGDLYKNSFSTYENKDLISKEGDFEFYLLYNKPNIDGLSDKSKKEYEEMYNEIKNFKNSIKVFKPVSEKEKLTKHKQLEFKAKTLEGKEIDSSIFKENKLTMINVWATFCGPCREEMPDIQKLYEEVKKDNINVIGIIADTPDDENQQLAKNILKKKDVKFDNIIPDETIKNGLLKDTTSMPTTFFVDSNGNIIGDFIIGSHSKEDYKKEINNRLAKMK